MVAFRPFQAISPAHLDKAGTRPTRWPAEGCRRNVASAVRAAESGTGPGEAADFIFHKAHFCRNSQLRRHLASTRWLTVGGATTSRRITEGYQNQLQYG